MRIAVSGTHFTGKSTLIEDFRLRYPHYKLEIEPYYQLQDEKTMELGLEPSLESILEQLDYSIDQLQQAVQEKNVIFDRCPVDFLAYAMCHLNQNDVDMHDSEVSERLPDIKIALDRLDMIVFLPLSKENALVYTEDNPAYRQAVDRCFKKIYRDDLYDIFPSYYHPRVIELEGDRMTRLSALENALG